MRTDRTKDQLERIRKLFLVEYRLILAVILWQLHIVLELQCDLNTLFTYDFDLPFLIKLKTLSPPQQQIPHHAPQKASKNSKPKQLILGHEFESANPHTAWPLPIHILGRQVSFL